MSFIVQNSQSNLCMPFQTKAEQHFVWFTPTAQVFPLSSGWKTCQCALYGSFSAARIQCCVFIQWKWCAVSHKPLQSLCIFVGNTGGKLTVSDASKAQIKEKKNKLNFSVAVRGRLIATSGGHWWCQSDGAGRHAHTNGSIHTLTHTHIWKTFCCEHLALSMWGARLRQKAVNHQALEPEGN